MEVTDFKPARFAILVGWEAVLKEMCSVTLIIRAVARERAVETRNCSMKCISKWISLRKS
jgi:hypothetical protein